MFPGEHRPGTRVPVLRRADGTEAQEMVSPEMRIILPCALSAATCTGVLVVAHEKLDPGPMPFPSYHQGEGLWAYYRDILAVPFGNPLGFFLMCTIITVIFLWLFNRRSKDARRTPPVQDKRR